MFLDDLVYLAYILGAIFIVVGVFLAFYFGLPLLFEYPKESPSQLIPNKIVIPVMAMQLSAIFILLLIKFYRRYFKNENS